MKTEPKRSDRWRSTCRMGVGSLALLVCLASPALLTAQEQGAQSQSAQDQQNQSEDATASADSTPPPAESGAPPDTQAQPSAPSSGWHYNPSPEKPAPENSAPQSAPPAAENAPAPPEASAPQGSLPHTLTVQPGTTISVRLREWLSSDQNHAGDTFSAELDQPIVIDGWVVARRGQSVLGRVVLAQKANHGNNESKLGVELSDLTLVDGERLPISTELQQDSKTRSQGHDAATVGVTTAIGAIIGAAIGGGQGAAIGAGAGLGAGMATVMVTPGRPTVLHPEQLLMFRLQSAAEIDTERGHVAFRPVTQADYGRDQQADANRPTLRRYPPRGPYAPYPYGPAAYPPPPYYYGCAGPAGWGCYYRR